ncbi:MAG: hypothetical protein R2699_17785 [Acidimicrobiales bacterium]
MAARPRQQPVALEAAAGHDGASPHRGVAARRRGTHLDVTVTRVQRLHGDPGTHHDVVAGQLADHGLDDRAEVHDGGPRHRQGGHAGDVRLDGGEAPAVERVTGDAVGDRPAAQLVEPSELADLGRHNDLAAAHDRHAPGGARGFERRLARGAQLCLGGSRRVVDPRVQHPAVVPGLVATRRRFFVEHEELELRGPAPQRPRRRQADDAGADHDDVGVETEARRTDHRRILPAVGAAVPTRGGAPNAAAPPGPGDRRHRIRVGSRGERSACW